MLSSAALLLAALCAVEAHWSRRCATNRQSDLRLRIGGKGRWEDCVRSSLKYRTDIGIGGLSH